MKNPAALKNNSRFENPVVKMVFSAIMIAAATVLSTLILFHMPNGGTITVVSMLPIILLGYIYGPKWGIFTGFIYGIIQLFLGLADIKGVSLTVFVGAVLLDFLVAFSVLGLSGIFKRFFKKQTVSLVLGTLFVCLLRFICHFISGFLLWGDLTEGIMPAVLFSLGYNFSYMGPETLATVIGAALFSGAVDIFKLTSKSR